MWRGVNFEVFGDCKKMSYFFLSANQRKFPKLSQILSGWNGDFKWTIVCTRQSAIHGLVLTHLGWTFNENWQSVKCAGVRIYHDWRSSIWKKNFFNPSVKPLTLFDVREGFKLFSTTITFWTFSLGNVLSDTIKFVIKISAPSLFKATLPGPATKSCFRTNYFFLLQWAAWLVFPGTFRER